MNRSRLTNPETVAPVDLSPLFSTVEDHAGLLDWNEFFGNSQPVEVEIGSGRGLFLMNASRENPQTNYLGIELDYKEGRFAAKRLLIRNIENVRILGGDARDAIARLIPSGSVAAAHVYFPDPWWKRRHRSRRIFNGAFVDAISRILAPGGQLHSWTDVEEYFQVITRLVSNHFAFREVLAPREREAKNDMDYHTNFERKKRKSGLPIYRARWERVGSP